MVDIFSNSAKLCIYVPKFYWGFKYYILHIARPYLPKIIAWALEAVVGINLDLFHKLGKRGVSVVAWFGVTL